MKDPNDPQTIKKLVLCDSDDDEDIVLDESDTDEKEHISKSKSDYDLEKCSQNKFQRRNSFFAK